MSSTDDLFQRKSLQCTKLHLRVFHGWRFSGGWAILHSILNFFVLFVGIKSPQYRVLHSKILLPSPCQQLVVSWFFFVLGNPVEVYSLTRINKPSLTNSSRRKYSTTSTKRCLLMLRSTLRELGTKRVVSLRKLYHVICLMPVQFLQLESDYQNKTFFYNLKMTYAGISEGREGGPLVLTPLHKYNSLYVFWEIKVWKYMRVMPSEFTKKSWGGGGGNE